MTEIINAITMAAPAKINLYLHVTGKRDDGYHLLDSLVAFAGVHDIITIAAANQLTLINQGPFSEGLPTTADNLVMRAAEQLRNLTGIIDGAQITLTKNLPIASGIGGGSADAAAAIKGLVRHWGVHPGHHDLSGLALGLGADVPICLYGQAAFIGGIGEQIEPVYALPEAPMVLVNPGVGVSTPTIFKARKASFSLAHRIDDTPSSFDELIELLTNNRSNDLTEPAIQTEPIIGDVLKQLELTRGCQLARMSGSGATCFGFYNTQIEADMAASEIKNTQPEWWVVATRLVSDARTL
jgi:4-diphosphocytidyl-2-C-methyl-D-erythritol kinase